MIIGGQALLIHGEPRFTQDIDITLGINSDEATKLLNTLKDSNFTPLISHPINFILESNVLPIKEIETEIRLNLIFSNTPYERSAIKHAIKKYIDDTAVHYISAEDLIIHKLVAGRPRDHEDILSILIKQGNKINDKYIDKYLTQFIKIPGLEAIQKNWHKIKTSHDP